MKRWWKFYRLSCELDRPAGPAAPGHTHGSSEPNDPQVRTWLAIHTRLQESARTRPLPPPDLPERILRAVRRAEIDPAKTRAMPSWHPLRLPVAVGAGLMLLALTLAVWFRPSPPPAPGPEPLALVSQTQIQAHQWIQRILDPDLPQLERELEQNRPEAQAALAPVLASIP